MGNIVTIADYHNDLYEMTEEDYHVPAKEPYTQDHLEINADFFNRRKYPAYFSLDELGYTYIGPCLYETDELKEAAAYGDKQKYRKKPSPARPDIGSSIRKDGKDIKEKAIALAVRSEDGEFVPDHLFDGNSFYHEAEKAGSPNFMTLQFLMNDNWSESNSIAAGIFVNLYFKKRGDATTEDIKFALQQIAKSPELSALIESGDVIAVSIRLKQYYDFMINGGVGKKTTDSVTINTMINEIINEESDTEQALSTSQSMVLEDAKNPDLQGGMSYATDKTRIITAYGYYFEKMIHHWTVTGELRQSPKQAIHTIVHLNGADLSDNYWWIKRAKTFLKELQRQLDYLEFRGVKNDLDKVIGFYQSVDSLSEKWSLRSIVTVEEVENYYDELKEQGLV